MVLTRRVGEAIKIGDDVELRVLSMKGSQIRIGVDAPDDVDIVREEMADQWRGRDSKKTDK